MFGVIRCPIHYDNSKVPSLDVDPQGLYHSVGEGKDDLSVAGSIVSDVHSNSSTVSASFALGLCTILAE